MGGGGTVFITTPIVRSVVVKCMHGIRKVLGDSQFNGAIEGLYRRMQERIRVLLIKVGLHICWWSYRYVVERWCTQI